MSTGAMMAWVTPPDDESELLRRARLLSGRTLEELADAQGVPVPDSLRRAKGFVGQLVERALGATATSRAVPDFEALGVELKTIPVSRRGKVRESTFVCTIELSEIGHCEWRTSRARAKLSRVLWVPVLAEPDLDVRDRIVGASLLWSPDEEEEAALRCDWEELTGLIGRGDVEAITGHLGRFLQVRPKAANSRARRRGRDEDDAPVDVLPRGFYLRTRFTEALLARQFAQVD